MLPFPKIRLGVSLILFLSVFLIQTSAGQNCIMICNDTINVDIELEGYEVIEPDMLLEDPTQCPGPYRVDVFVAGVSIGDTIRCDLFGQILKTEVTFLGIPQNSCESYIRVEDKSAPVLVCNDTIVPCGLDADSVRLTSIKDNCDPDPEIYYSDIVVDSFCTANIYNAIIDRTWGAKDNQNNISFSCKQRIYFKKPSLSDVVFPNDVKLTDTFSIAITPSNIDSLVGIVPPLIDGHPIGFYCKFNVLWEDQVFPICPGSFKILRKWTVLNCCTGQKREAFQMIEFLDETPPVILCPDSLTISTSPDDCAANFNLPAATVTDDNTLAPIVTVNYPTGQLFTNGGIVLGLPVGFNDFKYIAEDSCGNIDSCFTVVEVVDDVPPVAICIEKLTVNINSRSEGCVKVASFDAGSYDNCCLDSIAVKRMGETDDLFRDRLCLYCDDIGDVVMTVVRFIDCYGNINECMTELRAQDKIAPEITCPDSISLQCTVDFRDTSLTGSPTAMDNCDSLLYRFTDDTSGLNLCHEGLILRKWYVTDGGNLMDSCIQKITLIDTTPTVFINVPNDTTLYFCPTDLDSLNAGIPEPVADCEKWAVNISDTLFRDPCTLKVDRTFRFREWCSGDEEIFKQEITIIDTLPPMWNHAPGSLDTMVQCESDIPVPSPSANSLCAASVSITRPVNRIIPGNCRNNFTQIYGYVATNNCGSVSDTFLVTIIVNDTIAPEITGIPRDTTVGCDQNLPGASPVVTDNCGFLDSLLFTEEVLSHSCPEVEKVRQIWIAEDACGNRDSVSRILTRIDTVPPTAPMPTDSFYFCPEDVPPPNPEVVIGETDNCSLPVDVTLFQDDTIDSRCRADTLFRIYQLADSCGNISFVTHRIFVEDTIPPRVQSCPFDTVVTILSFTPGLPDCIGLVENLDAVYLDNCPSNIVTVTNDSEFAINNDSSSAAGYYPLGIHVINFFGTDECNNVNAECTVTIEVIEEDLPTVVCQGGPIIVEIDSLMNGILNPRQVIPEFWDYCSTVEINVEPSNFTCADLTTNPVVIDLTIASATDTFGNTRDCLPTRIILRDLNGYCPIPPPKAPGFIGGVIKNSHDQVLEEVTINVSGDKTDSSITNKKGEFLFENVKIGDNIVVKPYKNTTPTQGVTTFDLMMMSRIILGNGNYSPAQFIAADVDRSGTVTVRDITELRKLILDPQLEFSNNTSWRFIDSDYIFQNSGNPLSENFPESIESVHQTSEFDLDFLGIKIGDLNGDAQIDSIRYISDRSKRLSSVFSVENSDFKPGEKVKLKIKSDERLEGFQFALAFDESRLVFEEVYPKAVGLTDKNFSFSKAAKGLIPISFNGKITSGEMIFEMEFTAMSYGNLDEVIFFDYQKMKCEAYSEDWEVKNTVLEFSMKVGETEDDFELYQNQPNPFSMRTKINCRLYIESQVKLEIFDLNGQLIFEDRKRFLPGIRTFEIDNRFFRESGVYTYQLTTPNGVKTKRMVFIK